MKNKYFDTIVKKLIKYKGKLTNTEKLKGIIENILDTEYSDQKLYKMIYYLKNRGYLQNLKKNIFLIKSPENEYTDQQLLEMFYWNVVKKHCKEYLHSNWYIGGLKALELNLASFDIPDELLIVNQYKQSNEVLLFDKQVTFKTYITGEKNIFNQFNKFTKKVYIGKNVFPIANLELALLEALYNPSLLTEGYTNELVKKILRKHKKHLNLKTRETILKNNKHHSSINRLYKLAQGVDPTLYESIKVIIKKYSYFIG